jgi:hypothetical protein
MFHRASDRGSGGVRHAARPRYPSRARRSGEVRRDPRAELLFISRAQYAAVRPRSHLMAEVVARSVALRRRGRERRDRERISGAS